MNEPSGRSCEGRSHTACGTLPRTRRRRTQRSPMCTAWRSAPTVFGSPSEISDVNDLLDANESTRVFVALGDCSVGSICVERIERERHLARPVGDTGLLAKSHAGQHQQEHRRAAHESVCGASRRYRTRTRTLPAARRSSIVRIADPVCSIENCAPMTGSRTPDFSSGISSLHCHRGISG